MGDDYALVNRVRELTLEVAKVVGVYRRQLEENGVPEAEAWALAQRLEERILGPVYDQAEVELRGAPWEAVEALLMAVVDLQLVMGMEPDAAGAVEYMRQAGVNLPKDIDGERAAALAKRVPISPEEILSAFAQD